LDQREKKGIDKNFPDASNSQNDHPNHNENRTFCVKRTRKKGKGKKNSNEKKTQEPNEWSEIIK